MVDNIALRDKVEELQDKADTDRQWWDVERASIQSKFMKELEEDSISANKSNTTSTTGAAAAAAKNASTAAAGGAGMDKVNSDEDAVLVEGGGPGSTPGSAKGTLKKKKGKK